MPKTVDKEAIQNQVKAAAESFGARQMAIEIGKPYSTLSNELRSDGFAKLGFMSALSILETALDPKAKRIARENAREAIAMICEAYGYVCYRIPEPRGGMVKAMRLMGRLSKEFGESMSQMAEAIEDGDWSHDDVASCRKENRDLLKACLEVDAYLDRIAAAAAAN